VSEVVGFGGIFSRLTDLRLIQGLRQIFEDVVDVLDADAQANHLRGDADAGLFFGGELAVGGGGGVAGEGFGVAHVDHALEEPEAVEAFSSGLEAAFTPKVSREQALLPR
jgi:hypothetical protein